MLVRHSLDAETLDVLVVVTLLAAAPACAP